MGMPSNDELDRQSSAAALRANRPRETFKHVLVVDDAGTLRTTMARMLSTQGGYATCEAGTFLEALDLLDSVDAVATDGFYPYTTGEASASWGLTLARLARAYGKRVVLVSGHGALIQQAQWEGIRTLEKPRGILELAAVLAEAEGSDADRHTPQ